MRNIKIKGFQAWKSGATDGTQPVVFGIFSSEEDANTVAGRNNGEVKELNDVIKVYDTVEEWETENNDAALKAEALAALTPEQRRVLGL